MQLAALPETACNANSNPLLPFVRSRSPRRRVFLHHARILQHVGPLPAGPSMAMLEMLPEMIRPVKLLGRVALPELVHVLKMSDPLFPILLRGMPGRVATDAAPHGAAGSRAFLPAVAASINLSGTAGRIVKGPVIPRQR